MFFRLSKPASFLFELVILVLVAVGLAFLIRTFIVRPYKIPSTSMAPTLQVGQRVLVNRIGKRFGHPEVGQVVVFHPPTNAESEGCAVRRLPGRVCDQPGAKPTSTNYIKRIVAGPGDKLKVIDGRVIRNGRRIKEPYIRPCGTGVECNFPHEAVVPTGHYFVMGDNRAPMQSNDSRFWGPVPEDWIVGHAFGSFWPPKRVGLM